MTAQATELRAVHGPASECRATERTEHEPGDHHRYRIECEVCGQRGTIRLSIDPDRADLAVDVPPDSRPEEPPR